MGSLEKLFTKESIEELEEKLPEYTSYPQIFVSLNTDEISIKNEIYINAGSNNRLTEFQAILGISQLNKLESFVKHRIIVAGVYKNKLSQLV